MALLVVRGRVPLKELRSFMFPSSGRLPIEAIGQLRKRITSIAGQAKHEFAIRDNDHPSFEKRVTSEEAHWNDIIQISSFFVGAFCSRLNVSGNKEFEWKQFSADRTCAECVTSKQNNSAKLLVLCVQGFGASHQACPIGSRFQ